MNNEYYHIFDCFGMICLVAMFLVLWVWPWLSILGVWLSWRYEKNKTYPKRSGESDDFMEERDRVLGLIQGRMKGDAGYGLFSSEDQKDFESLLDSSEVASLFRCAHFAGYHLTFEQDECRWSADPEYLDPKVYKTDMSEAADLREQRKWNEYKRYFDPPLSKRDRILKEKS